MPGFEVLGEEEKKEILEVLDKGVLFRYEFKDQRNDIWKVREFEEAFAKYTGAKHALAVSSGSAALKVALVALGVSPGDEVIVPAFTFVATWEAVMEIGAVPVFADIDWSLNLNPGDLARRITPRTKAIICVHMLGGMAHIDKVVEAAGNIPVLEDTAQACGGSFKGRGLGTFGAVGTFSFDSVKTLTTGEGGMLVTNDQQLWTKASEYHDHGHDHRPVGRGNEGHSAFGFNYRMMELQGALGLAQLRKVPAMIQRQRANKERLRQYLTKIPGITFREIPDPDGDTATFISFCLPDDKKADDVNKALTHNNAGAVQFHKNLWHYYGMWEHLHDKKSPLRNGWPFTNLGGRVLDYFPDEFPRTRDILKRTLVWPININMSQEDFDKHFKAIDIAAEAL